jgi:hypothetical protein
MMKHLTLIGAKIVIGASGPVNDWFWDFSVCWKWAERLGKAWLFLLLCISQLPQPGRAPQRGDVRVAHESKAYSARSNKATTSHLSNNLA